MALETSDLNNELFTLTTLIINLVDKTKWYCNTSFSILLRNITVSLETYFLYKFCFISFSIVLVFVSLICFFIFLFLFPFSTLIEVTEEISRRDVCLEFRL